jgi:hypothetical protein
MIDWRGWRTIAGGVCLAALIIGVSLIGASLVGTRAFAQDEPSLTVDNDVSAFAISADNTIAYSVPHLKRFDKIVIERDEIWIASSKRKFKQIIDPDKFMPTPPPQTYIVQSISWSPDSQRLALAMMTKQYPWSPKVKGKKKGELDDDDIDNTYDDNNTPTAESSSGNAIALLDPDGREIKVANSKTRFIMGGVTGTWLSDGKTFVYLNGGGEIVRVTPDDGKSTPLFDGKTFAGVAFDTPRDRAYAIGEGLTPLSGLALVQLGLQKETIAELTRIRDYQGSLTVSGSGNAVGYFSDGDTIEIRNLANPSKAIHLHTGPGRFEFDRDDRRILLKRGVPAESNDLVWVRLDDSDFSPILHDLIYHDFHIAPDGNSVGVVDVGKGFLKVYPLE